MTVSKLVKDKLRGLLENPPDSDPRLWTTADLSEELGHSPKTIDNALRSLADDGLVHRVRGGRHMPPGKKAITWALTFRPGE